MEEHVTSFFFSVLFSSKLCRYQCVITFGFSFLFFLLSFPTFPPLCQYCVGLLVTIVIITFIVFAKSFSHMCASVLEE